MKKYQWIERYEVAQAGDITILTGDFNASAGSFKIEYQGDGGNADTYVITLSGSQYELETGKPVKFTITGEWEIHEVTDMFKLLMSIRA